VAYANGVLEKYTLVEVATLTI